MAEDKVKWVQRGVDGVDEFGREFVYPGVPHPFKGGGGDVDPADLISGDAGNVLRQGSDDKLFVPEGAAAVEFRIHGGKLQVRYEGSWISIFDLAGAVVLAHLLDSADYMLMDSEDNMLMVRSVA